MARLERMAALDVLETPPADAVAAAAVVDDTPKL
jgi:hypothetical protein